MGQTTKTKYTLVKETLSNYYQNVIESRKPKIFFENLIDYVASIKNNNVLEDIVKQQISAQKESDLKQIRLLAQATQQKMSNTFEIIEKFVNQKNMRIPEIDDWKKNNQIIFTKDVDIISNNDIENRKKKLDYILIKLFNNKENRNYIKNVVRQNGNNIEFIYAKSYFEYKSEQEDVKRMFETKIWRLWDTLSLIADLYSKYGKMRQDLLQKRDCRIMLFPKIGNELNQITNNIENTDNFQCFNQEEIRERLKKFNNNLNRIVDTLIIDEVEPKKFPYKLPAGTKWENITIKFRDNEKVTIFANGKELQTDFVGMGFDKGTQIIKPTKLWDFLVVLAKKNGEITSKDPEAKPEYKKQKELLSKELIRYFSITYDPFHTYHKYPPYKHDDSYKIRIILYPPEEEIISDKKRHLIIDEPNDILGIRDSYNEQTQQI